ncbi:MAG: T9SS type A sorting domain-containing protein [Ignavibacteriae bacterium]|nr:T9SS type A sorting domain-containing protein [Ignavibacteriota bacterium]
MVWNDFPPIGKKKKEQDPKFRVYRANYERENNAAIRTVVTKISGGKLNNGVLRQLIDYIYDYRQQTNFACSQADVISHSMGGMVARNMSENTKYYFTNKNYLAGLIHKLITIDTPHLGSEYADLLWKSYTDLNAFQKWLLKKVLVANVYNDGPYDPDNPVDGGAIEDLQTISPTIAMMNQSDNIAKQPPVHTFVGRASIAQQVANNINVSTLSRWFLDAGALTFGQVFLNKQHDLVVSEPSQEAYGVFDNYPKRVTTGDSLTHSPFKLGNPVISHTSGFGNKVLFRINSSRNSNLFSTNGRKTEFADKRNPDDIKSDQDNITKKEEKNLIVSTQGLKITTPLNEANLRFGETYNIDIEPSPGINLNRVIITGFEGIEEDSTPPFSFTLTVPFNYLMRKKQIFAIGEDSNGNVGIDSSGNLLTDSINVNLITDYSIVSIESGYEQTMNIRMGDSNNAVHTIGYFLDGAEREITWSEDIQYSSSNPGIFTVEQGAIYPVSPGEATLTVSYKGQSDSVNINVISDNDAPVIVIEKLVKVFTGNDVALNANQSYDPEQENITFDWKLLQKPEQSQVSIASPNQSSLNFNADQTGFYIFRLKVTDESGNSDSSYVSVEANPETGVKADEKTVTAYYQISPNPCEDKATLTYSNLKDESVSISLINSFGIETAVISENTHLSPGNHKLEINTGDLTSGIYFLRLRTGTSTQLVKFVVVR